MEVLDDESVQKQYPCTGDHSATIGDAFFVLTSLSSSFAVSDPDYYVKIGPVNNAQLVTQNIV